MESNRERAILIGQEKESLDELYRLAKTAGVEVIDRIYHRGDIINAAYYIGSGKLKELKEMAVAYKLDLKGYD